MNLGGQPNLAMIFQSPSRITVSNALVRSTNVTYRSAFCSWHKAHQDDTSSVSKKAAYSNICKTVQTKLRDMQDSWLRKKTEEIQSFADRKDMKKFHDALKTIYGPKSSGATTLLSADGNTLLTDKEAILERWAEHFNSVLNRPSSINEDAIDRLPQIECNVLLDEFPTVTETRKAVQQLSSGKAPGADAIPAEVNKAGGLPMAEKLTELFHCMWRKEAIPQEFKDASIIHLYKRKGNPQVCDNHRGISLLSIAGKILAKILLNRLNVHLDQTGLIPESQCGFRKDRGTIDMIFTARQLQEKCQEQNAALLSNHLGNKERISAILSSVTRISIFSESSRVPRKTICVEGAHAFFSFSITPISLRVCLNT